MTAPGEKKVACVCMSVRQREKKIDRQKLEEVKVSSGMLKDFREE